MADTSKRWRTEYAFGALRAGTGKTEFVRILEKLKKQEAREAKKREAGYQVAVRRRARTVARKHKRAAAERRRLKARETWDQKRDRLHLALIERGLEPVGIGGHVTERDVYRVQAIYGEAEALRLQRFGEGHRRGYVLNLGDMILVRSDPEAWTTWKQHKDFNSEYARDAISPTLRRMQANGFLEKGATGADYGSAWMRCEVNDRPSMYAYRLTQAGRDRRDDLIMRLNQLGEPVSAILKGPG